MVGSVAARAVNQDRQKKGAHQNNGISLGEFFWKSMDRALLETVAPLRLIRRAGWAFDKQSYLPALSMHFLGAASYQWHQVPYRRYFKSIVLWMEPIKTPYAACSTRILQLGRGDKAHADRCIENLITANPPTFCLTFVPQEPIMKRRGRFHASSRRAILVEIAKDA